MLGLSALSFKPAFSWILIFNRFGKRVITFLLASGLYPILHIVVLVRFYTVNVCIRKYTLKNYSNVAKGDNTLRCTAFRKNIRRRRGTFVRSSCHLTDL